MCRSTQAAALAIALAALLMACAPPPPEARSYEARVRRTAYGVPHIVAEDLGSLAFGQGYAFAADNACALADQVLKVRGERARFFGRGDDDVHVDSDFAYRHLGLLDVAKDALAAQPAEAREMIRGYAAGYNAFLVEQPGRVPSPCRGADWLRPLSEVELMAYYVDLSLLGSSRQLLPMIATATPPSAGALRSVRTGFPDLKRPGMGSNGWAIGGDRSAHGGGLLVGNPHFPWEGELKLGEVHLTVPGELDVYGATLMGVVGVLVGFNEHVAWTHTVSFAPRMTLYALSLHPGDPTAYLYDDEVRPMRAQEHVIEVRAEDGSLHEERRTLWRTHWGPMLDMPLYGWGSDVAFSYRDANLESAGFVEQFRRMSVASSVAQLRAAHDDVQGIPWVHTIAVDDAGDALYADGSTVPNVSDAALARWLERRESDFYTRMLRERGAVLLEGSGVEAEWVDDPRAARPGILPFEEAPLLLRRDFVVNANDNHWLANPASPLEGYSPLYGDERTPRGARTRMNLMLVQEGDAPLTREEATERLLSNRGLHAELLLDEVLARCPRDEEADAERAAACALLAAWDRRYDEDSVGAVLFRELLGAFGHDAMKDAGALYQVAFDPDDPVATPRALAAPPPQGEDPLLAALDTALQHLHDAGLAPDARLGDVQHLSRAGLVTPIHGGAEIDGVANIVGQTSLPSTLDVAAAPDLLVDETALSAGGYEIDYGGSFVFTVELGADGPQAEALLIYGQAGDPTSPHFGDQLPLYREKTLRPVLFSEEEIAADPGLVERTVKGSDAGL